MATDWRRGRIMIKAKNGKVYMKGNNIQLTSEVVCILSAICEKDDLLPMRLVLEKTLNLNFTELKELLNKFKEA